MKLSPSVLLDLIYPRRCALCDCVLSSHEPYICRECAPLIHFRSGPVCIKCGRSLDGPGRICVQCADLNLSYDACFAPFPYGGAVKESIMRFKYHDRPEYAGFYAAAIIHYGGDRIMKWAPHAIIPVPAHRSRLIQRGYNQSMLIAKEISKATGIPLYADLVSRAKKTEALKELGPKERRNSMKDAFVYKGDVDPPEKVLIVDDILTTGSTMDSLAELLKIRGTCDVYGACISS